MQHIAEKTETLYTNKLTAAATTAAEGEVEKKKQQHNLHYGKQYVVCEFVSKIGLMQMLIAHNKFRTAAKRANVRTNERDGTSRKKNFRERLILAACCVTFNIFLCRFHFY